MFGIGEAVAAGLQVLNKFIPDEGARAQAELELRRNLQQWDQAQTAVAVAEATNEKFFVSGARPFILWVCGCALLYSYILVPVGLWITFMVGHPVPKPPVLDERLFELMIGMLGLGGLRTFEKIKGVASK
jgi:hypothetical protein